MEKKIFFKNERAIEALEARTERVKAIIQKIVEEFRNIGISITEISEINDFLNNKRIVISEKLTEFIFNKLYPITPRGINRNKYKEIVELPELTHLTDSIEALNGYFGSIYFSDSVDWQVYKVGEGKVSILESEHEKLKMQFIEFAETELEKQRLEVVEKVCISLNELINFTDDYPGEYSISGVTIYNEEKNVFVPDPTWVKHSTVNSQKILFGHGQKTESLKSAPAPKNPPVFSPDDSDEVRAAEMAKARS